MAVATVAENVVEGLGVASPRLNLLNYSLPALTSLFLEWGEKPFRAKQVFQWMHKRTISDFNEMSDLSKSLRARLIEQCVVEAPIVAREQCSTDGTRKWLIKLADGNYIETVFIPEPGRGTLCVSSQVGCALNCQFCSTATQGFNRNLTIAEIIGQVWQAFHLLKETDKKVTNVVMMGMGEPLLNFEAVVAALSIMRSDLAYSLPRRRVTLSTAGFVPYIDRLAEESDVSLALSLHAPNNELRSQLVPLNKKFPIEILIPAVKRFAGHRSDPTRFITIEYVMLKDVNDSVAQAKELIKVLADLPCKINLIPFNSFKGSSFKRSDAETIYKFQSILVKAGFVATVRKTRGDDIDAACGQLKGQIMDKTKRQERWLKLQIKEEGTVCGSGKQACG